jgi:ribosomal-protein-serine acetyltransferase
MDTLELRHAEELFALTDRNRDYLRRWLPWLDGIRVVEDTRSFIRATLAQTRDNRGFQAAIVSRGTVTGVVGHHQIDWRNRATAIGYWLGEEHQGQGLVTAACRRLVDHGFGVMGLHRVEIRCAVENHRSRAVPQRLGFGLEGEFREAEWLYDHWVDHVVYAGLATDRDQTAPTVVERAHHVSPDLSVHASSEVRDR